MTAADQSSVALEAELSETIDSFDRAFSEGRLDEVSAGFADDAQLLIHQQETVPAERRSGRRSAKCSTSSTPPRTSRDTRSSTCGVIGPTSWCRLGVIGIHNAGNIGMAGYYVKLASDHGLIGIVMAHTPAIVVPYGGAESILGTNPLAIGIPAQPYPIILDMATSAVGFHQVMMAKATGQPLPPGSALDKYGRPTNNPDEAVEDGIHFLPFGGYKGSGLSLMIEILAGCWTNSLVGAEKTGEMRSDFFSSLFIAMQPELLISRHQFEARIQILMERIKTSKPAAGFTAIRLPGESGQQNRESLLKAGRLELDAATAAYLRGGE